MATPLVSVLVPACDAESTVELALASLVAQTYPHWEAILVDDGSTDATWPRSASIEDPRIRRYRSPGNCGRGAARQFALEKARGSLICALDADDWYYPWKLEVQVAEIAAHPQAALVGCGMASAASDGRMRGAWLPPAPMRNEMQSRLRSLTALRFPHASCMTRAEAARRCGYRPRLRRAEDFHFLARALQAQPFYLSSRILYVYADEESYRREGPVPRYLWSARACLHLWREYPVAAPVLALRKMAQAGLAGLSGGRRWGFGMGPEPAGAEALREYDEARTGVSQALRAASVRAGGGR